MERASQLSCDTLSAKETRLKIQSLEAEITGLTLFTRGHSYL